MHCIVKDGRLSWLHHHITLSAALESRECDTMRRTWTRLHPCWDRGSRPRVGARQSFSPNSQPCRWWTLIRAFHPSTGLVQEKRMFRLPWWSGPLLAKGSDSGAPQLRSRGQLEAARNSGAPPHPWRRLPSSLPATTCGNSPAIWPTAPSNSFRHFAQKRRSLAMKDQERPPGQVDSRRLGHLPARAQNQLAPFRQEAPQSAAWGPLGLRSRSSGP
jgi:hypothetical protein